MIRHRRSGLLAFFSESQLLHNPTGFTFRGRRIAAPESPERARQLLAVLLERGTPVVASGDHGLDPLLRVHTQPYLDFLTGALARWQALDDAALELTVGAYAVRPRAFAAVPRQIVGAAGWFLSDSSVPIGPGTWDAAYASAQTAVSAANALASGGGPVYALCRPPGHHARADLAGGGCLLNNAAIAVRHLQSLGVARIGLLDIDFHHGNGSQEIFWDDGSVITLSVHADPCDFFPFYAGHVEEVGGRAAQGANRNIVLPGGSGDADWIAAVNLLASENLAQVDAVVVALGLDAVAGDPRGGFDVSPAAFEHVGRLIAGLPAPVLVVQEGGYLNPNFEPAFRHFLSGLAHNPCI